MARTAVIVAASAALLVAGTSITTAQGAVNAGNTPPPPPPVAGTPTGGWLTLQTGAVNQVSYFPTAAAATAVQPLTAGATCQPLATDGSLLGIAGTPGGAALKYGSIGVIGAASPTKTCTQVNGPTESLDLTINLGGPVASAAFLDMEVKGSSRIVATAKLAGNPVATYELQTGSSIGAATSAIPSSCRTNDDYGNDDHEDGNCRWAISTPTWLGPDDGVYFDSLSLVALKGAFSLEGGADSGAAKVTLPAPLPPKSSFFELAADLIECGATSDAVGGGADAPVTFTRLGTNVDGSPCAPVAFSLTSQGNQLHFTKPLNVQTGAQYVFDVTWTLTASSIFNLTPTKVNWESVGSLDIELDGCPLPWSFDPSDPSKFLGSVTPPVAADDQDPVASGIQYACVGPATYTTASGGVWTAHEKIYLTGDVRVGH